MSSRLASLLVWALAAFCAVAWALRIVPRGPAASAQPSLPAAETPRLAAADVSRMLGNAPPAVVASASAPAPAPSALDRLRLLGVIAAPSGGAPQVAMIAFDGQPPRAWRIGQQVQPGWRLSAVTARGIELADGGGASRAFELPPPAAAAVGRPGAPGPAAMAPPPGTMLPPPIAVPQPQQGMPVAMPGMVPQAMPGMPGMPAEAAVDAAHAAPPPPVPLNMEAAAAAAEAMLKRR